MTTVDVWLESDRLHLHLGGGLFGNGSNAFKAFREAVDAGAVVGTYDVWSAKGIVPGSFLLRVLPGMEGIDVYTGRGGARLPAEEVLPLIDSETPFSLKIVEY